MLVTWIIVEKRGRNDSGSNEAIRHERDLTPNGNTDRVAHLFTAVDVGTFPAASTSEANVMRGVVHMRKLAFGALFVGLLVACSGGTKKPIKIVDAPPADGSGAICNPLAQTGCTGTDKCTWIIDMDDPNFSAHIGCAPDGTNQTGQACTRNPPGPTGYDDCAKGNYCFGPNAGGAGTCKLICDIQGGSPMCPTKFGCVGYQEIFSLPSDTSPPAAGVCEPTCDPLNDNNFLGSAGSKTGSACGTRGCFGLPPDFSTSAPTVFTCAGVANPSRVHRSACTGTQEPGDAASCLYQNKYIYPNSCDSGYQPLINDSEGSMVQDCVAMCAAQDCYSGNCPGSAFAGGTSGGVSHTCYDGTPGPKDILVDPASTNYTPPSATGNGEQCNYLWNLEFDASGMFVRSATSDSLGLCISRGLYYYDSNGDGMVTTTTGTDVPWPACNQITGLMSGSNGTAGSCPTTKYPTGTVCCYENGCLGADGTPNNTVYGPFACVSATKAGHFSGKGGPAVHRFPMLRLPYNRTMLKGLD